MELLVAVDVQNDFIGGALGSAEAQAVWPAMLEKIRGFRGPVWLTKDTHGPDYPQTQEGRLLPVAHCRKGTAGWEFPDELRRLVAEGPAAGRQFRVFEKPAFGSLALAQAAAEVWAAGGFAGIEVLGLCTDICVVANAMLLKAAVPEAPLAVLAACCAGTTPENHRAALATMASCQMEIRDI